MMASTRLHRGLAAVRRRSVWIKLCLRILVLLGIVGLGVWLELIRRQVVHGSTRLTVTLVVCVAFLGALTPVADAIRVVRRQTRRKFKIAMNDIAQSILKVVQKETGYTWYRLGVSIYTAKGPSKLERVAQVRIGRDPGPSNIAMTQDKGVVGMSVASSGYVHVDLRPLARKHAHITRAQFDDLLTVEKMGYSYREYRTAIARYAEVASTPVVNREGVVVGVLSIDIPLQDLPDDKPAKFGRPAVREAMQVTATAIANTLE